MNRLAHPASLEQEEGMTYRQWLVGRILGGTILGNTSLSTVAVVKVAVKMADDAIMEMENTCERAERSPS